MRDGESAKEEISFMGKIIDKNWTIAQVLQEYPETRSIFEDYGFMCLACPSSQLESLELGTRLHGIDPDEFVGALNERVSKASS